MPTPSDTIATEHFQPQGHGGLGVSISRSQSQSRCPQEDQRPTISPNLTPTDSLHRPRSLHRAPRQEEHSPTRPSAWPMAPQQTYDLSVRSAQEAAAGTAQHCDTMVTRTDPAPWSEPDQRAALLRALTTLFRTQHRLQSPLSPEHQVALLDAFTSLLCAEDAAGADALPEGGPWEELLQHTYCLLHPAAIPAPSLALTFPIPPLRSEYLDLMSALLHAHTTSHANQGSRTLESHTPLLTPPRLHDSPVPETSGLVAHDETPEHGIENLLATASSAAEVYLATQNLRRSRSLSRYGNDAEALRQEDLRSAGRILSRINFDNDYSAAVDDAAPGTKEPDVAGNVSSSMPVDARLSVSSRPETPQSSKDNDRNAALETVSSRDATSSPRPATNGHVFSRDIPNQIKAPPRVEHIGHNEL